jgi:hypothetical protein
VLAISSLTFLCQGVPVFFRSHFQVRGVWLAISGDQNRSALIATPFHRLVELDLYSILIGQDGGVSPFTRTFFSWSEVHSATALPPAA